MTRAFLGRVVECSNEDVRMEIMIVREDIEMPWSTIYKDSNIFSVNLSSPYAIKYMSRNMNELTIFGNKSLSTTQWVDIFNNPKLIILNVVRTWYWRDHRRAPNRNYRNAFGWEFLKQLNPKVDYPNLVKLRIYMPLRLDTKLIRKPFQIGTLQEFVLEDVDMYADAVKQHILVTQVLRSLRETVSPKKWTFKVQGNRIIGTKVSLLNTMTPLNSSDRNNFMIERF